MQSALSVQRRISDCRDILSIFTEPPPDRLWLQGSKGRGKDRGNGQIAVVKLTDGDGLRGNSSCEWKTEKVLNVPKTANFLDYSDLAIQKSANSSIARVLITSQEDAAVWAGLLDTEKFEFVGEGVVLHFPRSSDGCHMVYCNIEGVHFIDEYGAASFLFFCRSFPCCKHHSTSCISWFMCRAVRLVFPSSVKQLT